MKKFLCTVSVLFFINNNLFANENQADCIILKDENSIICKYIQDRVNFDKNVIFNWVEPNGEISRTKNLIIPAGHGSVYDYRYYSGRTKGIWTFKVTDGEKRYTTNFTVE